jgi:hypothetical protein
MDCRKFHRILEDYLEDGLDFSGRFGMERHAQQCIGCGKVLSDAQQLRRMARRLDKVKAPENFETTVLEEIGKSQARGHFFWLRRFWLYGFDVPSARRLGVAASCLAVLVAGVLYLSPTLNDRATSEIPPALVSPELAKSGGNTVPVPETPTVAAQPSHSFRVNVPQVRRTPEPSEQAFEQMVDHEVADTDYLEFQVIGPNNQPVSFRWPNKYRVRYGQTPEEYFLRNVSH